MAEGEMPRRQPGREVHLPLPVERLDDFGRIVTEELLGQRRMSAPALRGSRGAEQARKSAGRFIAEGDEIDRLAPGGLVLGAAGSDHLADDGWKHSRCVLPADEVE